MRSKTYVLKGVPQALVLRRSDDIHGWNQHKETKLLTHLELQCQHDDKPLFTGPLSLDATFYFSVPSVNKSKVRTAIGCAFVIKPSLFLLINFLEHAAHGIIYGDNALITTIRCNKVYDEIPRTEFTITELYEDKKCKKKNP